MIKARVDILVVFTSHVARQAIARCIRIPSLNTLYQDASPACFLSC